MELLVTGGSGIVGWDLVRRASNAGYDVTYTRYSTEPSADVDTSTESHYLDVRDDDRVRDLVNDLKPDIIVHAAAMTNVDECERDPERATAINVRGTEHVLAAAEAVDARLVFFSTGFVFDGNGDSFVEDSPRNAVNHYGETKIRGEDLILDSTVDSTICRIDQPYCWSASWQTPSFVEWVLNRLDSRDSFQVFSDWYNTPVYVPDCNEAVLRLLKDGHTGTFHVTGSQYTSRYDWAVKIAETFGYAPDIVKTGCSDDVDLPADRPNNHLSNEKIREEAGIAFRTLEVGAQEMLNKQ
ncbi:SDR family oxidoreductase [Haloplanus pelagicus]|uniref:SDR family oxidoreductase n=1 Tax=Haloplanus pelagicus TaxID=2949995 RepID=UPI00203A4A1C|nr:NAD(P)-dependent oxidoreductase [Haloplanus sp. HW8-1]